MEKTDYDYVIIGAGITGAIHFYYLSQKGNVLLLDRKDPNEKFISARIIVTHAQQYLPSEVPWDDKSIFIRDCDSIANTSRNKKGPIFGKKEFGERMGAIIDEQKFIHYYIEQGIKHGGKVLWETEVKKIDNSAYNDTKLTQVFAQHKKNEETKAFQASLVIIATGAYGKTLQMQSGFSIPDELNYLVTTFHVTPENLDKTCETDYFYHIHPQMSTRGPLQMTCGDKFFNIIYVSDESYDVMSEKLLRIYNNYQPIQYLFQYVQNKPASLTEKDFRKGKVWKHPVKEMTQNGIILSGEAAGLVTECYYEGILGGLACAKVLEDLMNNSEISDTKYYDKLFLEKYEKEVRNILLKNFHESQVASQDMFLSPGKHQLDIWDAYIEAINKHPQVRKNIYLAWVSSKLIDYPLENDEYCGEKIYTSLPLAQRLQLTPYFLKLKFLK